VNWYLEALKKYAVFHGRARRKEFWFFQLFFTLGSIALNVFDVFAGSYSEDYGYGLFGGLFSLAMLLPALAVSVRRLHDTDRTGWWVLLGLIPIIGIIVLIVFYVQNGTQGSNRFGEDPKAGPPSGMASVISG
jgi:uncharacterized membrane protein YhaH (DUF805 family)